MDQNELTENLEHPEIGAIEEKFVGAIRGLNDIRREDGLLTRQSTSTQSLLHRAISAVKDNTDYRQELKTALWGSPDEADDAVDALEECFALCMDPTPIIDQIIARSAGRNHDLLFSALRTLTHTSFTTNYRKDSGNGNRKGSDAGP